MHKDHELLAEEVRLLKKRPDLQPVSWKPESRERDDGQENPSFLLMLKNLYNREVSEAEKLQQLILAKRTYNEKSLITGAPQLPRGEIPRLQARLERHIEAGKFLLKILDLTVRNFYTDQNSRKSVYPRRANVLAMLGLTLTLPFAGIQKGCDDLTPPKPLSIPQEEEKVPTTQPAEQPTIAIATAIPPATGEAATPEAEQETEEEAEQPQATPHDQLEKFITATLTPESTLTQEGVQSEQTRLTDGTIVITKIKDGMVVAIATATPTETGIADEILYGTDTAQMALNAAGYPDKIVAQLKIVEFQLEGGFAAHRVEASDAEGNLLATVAPPTDIWILAPEPTIPVTPENPAEEGQGLNNPETLQIPTHEPSLQEFAEQSFAVNPENGDVTIEDVNGNTVDNIIFLNRAGLNMTMTYQPWSTEAVAAFQEFEDKFRVVPYENGRKNSLGQPLIYSWNPSTEEYDEVALPLPELDESGKIIPSSTPEWIFATLPMKDTLSYLNGKDLPFPFMLKGESGGSTWYQGAMYVPDDSGETAGKVYFYTTAPPAYEYYRVLSLTFSGATITARSPIQIKNFLGSTYNSLSQLGLDSLQVNGFKTDILGTGPEFKLQTGSVLLATTEEEKLTGAQLESFSQFKLSSGEILLHSQSDEQDGMREFHFVLLSQAEAGLRTVQTQVRVTGVLQLDSTGGFSINDPETDEPLVVVSLDRFSLLVE